MRISAPIFHPGSDTFSSNMPNERRKRERLGLRVGVLLLQKGSDHPILSETSDITNDGFYCTSPQPLSPGEKLSGIMQLPAAPSVTESTQLYVEAEIEIVRLAIDNTIGFGLGCRITDYRVITRESIPNWAAASGFGEVPTRENPEGAHRKPLMFAHGNSKK
jgi:hypothetical protein